MDEFNSAAGVADVMSYGDYWNQQNDAGNIQHGIGYMNGSGGNDFISRIDNWITGKNDKVKQQYDAYLTANERAYEQAKIKDARDYETWLQSTQYQRAVKDMEKAGLNPYLLVSGNGMSGATARANGSSARSATDAHESYQGNKQKDASGVLASLVGSALKVLAVLAA